MQLLIICSLAARAHASVILDRTVDSASGEIVVEVRDADDTSLSYQWLVDGRPLTTSPLQSASALVLYPDKPLPGANCQVLVFDGHGGTVASDSLLLVASNGTTLNQNVAVNSPGDTAGPISDSSQSQPGDGDSTHGKSSQNSSTDSPGILVNLSTRGHVGRGQALVAGLTIAGSGVKTILLRAIGPTLADFGVADATSDPKITLYQNLTVLGQNDDWSSTADMNATMQAVGAFPLRLGSKDAAISIALPPGQYTAVISANDSVAGTALVEFYDVSPTAGGSNSKLINLSTRGTAGPGIEAMVAGFVISGATPKRLLLRAVGPTLANFGALAAMSDPKLSLYAGGTLVAENDDWGASTDSAAISQAAQKAGAFALPEGSKDATVLITLAPGSYTAQLTSGGAGNARGAALIEIYEVPEP